MQTASHTGIEVDLDVRCYDPLTVAGFGSTSGPFGWFSNFAHAPMEMEEVGKAPTAEHFFQALKFTDPTLVAAILAAPTPKRAKQIAHSRRMAWSKQEWSTLRIEAMRIVIAHKAETYPTSARHKPLCLQRSAYAPRNHLFPSLLPTRPARATPHRVLE